jgi:hypothetical protein
VTGSWRRLGRLTLDVSAAPWAATHASTPVVEPLGSGGWSVYVSVRDAHGRSRIGRARLTMTPAPALTPLEPDPVLDLGLLGTFDDNGVTSSCLVTVRQRRYLYYTGWTRGVSVPFYLAAGLAVSDNDGPFRRLSHAPLLDRSPVDPYLTASPFVRTENGRWRMWYVSGTEWRPLASGPRHYYNIRYAESDDGIAWRRDGRTCLDYANDNEHAFARPCVLDENESYHMWYAVRGDRYRIGYAQSPDGLTWSRRDDLAGMEAAGDDWESEMVEYPWVFDADGSRFMLYNGNGYGRTGVGLAVWEPRASSPRQPGSAPATA